VRKVLKYRELNMQFGQLRTWHFTRSKRLAAVDM